MSRRAHTEVEQSAEQAPATVVELLRQRSLAQPGRLAYTFLREGESAGDALTYGELHRRACAIGARLQSAGLSGERALLLYPPGLEYVAAFFGCLYAGVVAVPVSPPKASRHLLRLQPIAAEARAQVALTSAATLPRLAPLLAQSAELQRLLCLATDDIPATLAEQLEDSPISGDSLAYLQYTSGSTSTPKGVMVSHRNILYNTAYIDDGFAHTPSSVSLTWLPHFHDMGLIYGVVQPLYGGFHCFMMSPAAFVQRPARWLEAIARYRVTHSGGPNFAYDLCVRKVTSAELAGLDLSSWRVAFNGAEPVRAETLSQFAAAFAPCGFRRSAFYPAYGLAEATLKVSGGRRAAEPTCRWVEAAALEQNRAVEAEADQPGARALVSSGCATRGTRVVIAAPEAGTLCPPGEVGEVWVAGAGVAQGYWNRPEETARTFQAYLADTGEGPFLRTGDLGFLSDGELFVTGRLKDMIVVRGLNHYPQDIELTVERSHPQLRAAGCAVFTAEVRGEERLVAVQEVSARRGLDVEEVAAAVRQAVAEQHELQVYAVVLVKPGGVPKTSSGKVQRQACRQSFLRGALDELGRSVLPESSPGEADEAAPDLESLLAAGPDERLPLLESYLARQVGQVLNRPTHALDRHRPLPALGLDSLTAIELKNRVERDLGVAVPVVAFLQDESIAQLAEQVWAQTNAPARARLRAGQSGAGAYPPSYGQKALWFIQQLAPQSTAYNIARAVRIRADLDVDALRRAFQALAARHAALRTTFDAAGGEPVQQVHAHAGLALAEYAAENWSEALLHDRLIEEAHRPFDLAQGPLWRASLFSRSPREHVLLLAVHHIVADFWSMGVLIRELGICYAAARQGTAAHLGPPTLQYTDYTRWQGEWLAGPEAECAWAYWREQLAGELPVLNLPTARPRPALQSYRGAAQSIRLDAELTDRLKALSGAHATTLYTTLLAAFQVLLHRYTGQTDILVGSPTSGRSRAELAELIGYFTNPVVIRARLTGEMTFAELLGQVRRTVLVAVEHEDFPFALLVERLQADRDPSRSPLFQVMFVLQQAQAREQDALTLFALGEAGVQVEVAGLTLESVALEQRTAQFDLTLMAASGDELALSLEYSTELFDAATIRRMLGHFKTLLAGIVADPRRRLCELPLLTAAERRYLLEEWNATAADYPREQCVHELFEAQAARTPAAPALLCANEEVTYAELNRRANLLARHLQRLGAGPETLVALCVERSVAMVVGMLGILKAGAAYVPLDPAYPRERLAFMLADARIRALVTDRSSQPRLPEHGAELVLLDALAEAHAAQASNPVGGVSPDNLAYVIYTSGSTGKPKGVMIEHRNVVNFFIGMDQSIGGAPPGVWLALTSISFDISALELLWTLTRGFGVLIYEDTRPASCAGGPVSLAALIGRHQVTHLQCTPSRAQMLISEPEARQALGLLRHLVVGGEAFPSALAAQLHEVVTGELHNMYGPTETTIWSTTQAVNGAGPITIGRPISNTEVFILDRELQPEPVGIPGELYIGGAGVARGYARRPSLTAERFIPHPFSAEPGARLYRTGDLARYLSNGEIEYLGRTDQQIKLRGFRVELGEIEAALRQHPAVREAVVAAREDEPGDTRLVAYVVSAVAPPPAPADLRALLVEKLPDYMAPHAFVLLDALPHTPNGKIDRRALPAPEPAARAAAASAYVGPRTPVEETLAAIWTEVLKVERVGIHDNFFAAGGHSLLMTQVISRLRAAFGVELPMQTFFQEPTIDSLAIKVVQLCGAQKGDAEISRLLAEVERM